VKPHGKEWAVVRPGILHRDDPLGQRGRLLYDGETVAYLHADGTCNILPPVESDPQFNILGDGSL